MFIIFGNLNFIPGQYDAWQAAYRELEAYVVEHERNSTLTYYFGVPEEYGDRMSESPQMLAFEAYNVRDDLYDTHFHSKPMGVFLQRVPGTMTTALDLVHFEDTAGYQDKPGNMKECGIFYVTRLTAKPGKRGEILQKLGKLASWVEKNEPNTYSYLVMKSLDNENDIRIWERYATRDDLENHMKHKEVLDFHMDTKEVVASMEGRGYTPNGAGWLHR